MYGLLHLYEDSRKGKCPIPSTLLHTPSISYRLFPKWYSVLVLPTQYLVGETTKWPWSHSFQYQYNKYRHLLLLIQALGVVQFLIWGDTTCCVLRVWSSTTTKKPENPMSNLEVKGMNGSTSTITCASTTTSTSTKTCIIPAKQSIYKL
jgi:hypothetical protein